jgi:hypothetical protein
MRNIDNDIEIISRICNKYNFGFNELKSNCCIMYKECYDFFKIEIYVVEVGHLGLLFPTSVNSFLLFYNDTTNILEPILLTHLYRSRLIDMTDEEIWSTCIVPLSSNPTDLVDCELHKKEMLIKGFHISSEKNYDLTWDIVEEEQYFSRSDVSVEEEMYYYECISCWL